MSKKSGSYLKKGEGTSRFGKIRYPKFGSSNKYADEMATKFAIPSSSSADSGHNTGSDAVDSVPDEYIFKPNQKHKGIFDGGDNSADSSFLDWRNLQKQLEKDHFETRRFERMEFLAENLSLNSDHSFYKNAMNDDNFMLSNGGRILKDNLSSDFYDHPHDADSQNHRLSTVREASNENLPLTDENLTRNRPRILLNDDQILIETSNEQNINGQKSSVQSSESETINVPMSDYFAQNFPPLPSASFLPPFFKQFQPAERQFEPLKRSANVVDDRKLIELGKKLESMMNVLSKDSENLEILKRNLENKEKLFESNSTKFQTEKREFQQEKHQFDVFVAEEMKKIDKERSILSKEKNSNQKKQNEQISLLRQQILDLQNETCERESRFSGSRAKIRQLEIELSRVKEENETLRVRCRHLEDNTTKLDKENAQLRCKNWSLKENIPLDFAGTVVANAPKTVSTQKPPCLTNGATSKPSSSSKSVRFLLPDDAPLFQRTEDRCVQTCDNPSEMSTQTSIIVDMPRPISTTATTSKIFTDPAQTSCFNILTDSNRQTLERRRSDGSKEIIHPNGTLEEVGVDGRTVMYVYTNGDSRKFETNGVEIYHFSSSNITQIRHPTGLTIVRYKDGREEKHYADGRIDVVTPDRVRRTVSPHGTETIEYPDGTTSEQKPNGPLVVSFPDGSKEIRTPEFTKREFASGDVKFRYKDGSEETRLVSGRIRIKDSKGKIIKDEQVKDIIIR